MSSSGAGGNEEQIAYWNGPGGQRWLDRQQMQDAILAPISRLLIERARPRTGEFVLDIGCGCGATTIELAQDVRPSGRVLGIDVSAPMLERAGERLPIGANVDYALADAATYAFERGRADLLFSRFGVMFFDEPVSAFWHMRQGLNDHARLLFGCWRAARENPWLMVPLQEAYRHVPRLPERRPEDPGPFAFANEGHVRDILASAGFESIAFEPVDLSLDLAGGQGLDAALDTALHVGPANLALEGQPAPLRAAAAESIRTALAQHCSGETVPLPGALWIVSARQGA